MKIQLINKKIKVVSILLILIVFGITSCRSSEQAIDGNNSQAIVKVNILGTESESEGPVKSATIGKAEVTSTIQRQIIPIDQQNSIIATLTPESASANNTMLASVNPIAGNIKQEKLKTGNEYVVVVYDDKGNYVDEKNFIYGQEQPGFQLDGGKTYTFIAYSVNYTSMANRMPKDAPLSQAKLEGIAGDLMFFKKTMPLTGGKENYLDVVLKHRYSQITTKIDASGAGNIDNVSQTTITPIRNSASISFDSPEQLTYGPVSSTGAIVNFPVQNQPIITSDPTLLISDGIASGELNIKSLTVAGVVRNDIKVQNLKITPGVKYGLDLKLDGKAVRTIKVLSLIPDSWNSNLSTGIYTVVARSKLDNKSNFGPGGKVRITGFDFRTVDVGATDAQFTAAIEDADIIWIGYIANSLLAAGSTKRAILEQKINEKKKFFFVSNNNGGGGFFPGKTTFAGHTFDYLKTGGEITTVTGNSGPTQGIFGNLQNGAQIYQNNYVGKVKYPSTSVPFLINTTDGSTNAVATNNFVTVGGINWYITYQVQDGFYNGTNSCTENNQSILFCNIFEKAINYFKNQPGYFLN